MLKLSAAGFRDSYAFKDMDEGKNNLDRFQGFCHGKSEGEQIPPIEARPFDLDKYLRVAGGTRADTFDWSDPGPKLDEGALFCLGYMMDVEAHTIVYLSELLRTSVVEDASITAFLSCWNYEEFLHSQVLQRFLTTQGVSVENERFARLRRRRPEDRFVQFGARILSRISRRHYPAIHMTWGAINEITAVESYRALDERTQHPLLSRILNRIIKDERRHFSFYFNQARNRLRYRAAQVLAATIIKCFWAPVGKPIRGESSTRRLQDYLYPDESARRRLVEADTTIARLPGFEWFNLHTQY